MKRLKTTRRQFIKTAALASAALTAPPFIRRSHAAGKLTVALWDHWVPASNDVQKKLMMDWAAKNKVDLTVDFVTSQGNSNTLMAVAESRAKEGHDVFMLPQQYPSILRDSLEPLDDIAAEMQKAYGKYSVVAEYACISKECGEPSRLRRDHTATPWCRAWISSRSTAAWTCKKSSPPT